MLSARLQETLKISVQKGSIQPWLGGDQPHNCQSDHSLNLPHAMPTPPHCTAQPHRHPTHHHTQTGQGNQAIHISIIPSYFILLVHLTCHLSSFSEPTDYSGAQRHGHSGKFSSTIHLAIFANLFLAFSLLIGRFDFLTLRLCASIQKRH